MGQLQNFETDLRSLISKYANLTANDAHTVLVAVDNELHRGAVALQNGSVNAVHALGFVKGGPGSPKAAVAAPAGSSPVWANPHAPTPVTGAAPAPTAAPVDGATSTQAPAPSPVTEAPTPAPGAAPAPASKT
jgi:pyruvate dehydrogenase E2 component (dihydrolipoamide acetyltransferase)